MSDIRRRSAGIMELGEIKVDGRRLRLLWITVGDTMLVNFTDGPHPRVGTVVGLDTTHSRLITVPDNHSWLTDERRESIVIAAMDHYKHRETLSTSASSRQ